MTNIAIENGPLIVDLPIKDGDFSLAMLVYQRVILSPTRNRDLDFLGGKNLRPMKGGTIFDNGKSSKPMDHP